MLKISKSKYFYFISLMLMASTFLHLVFNNLPPIIGSHHLWTIIWGISLIAFSPNIFLNKAILYLLFYGIFLYISTKTIWSNMDVWNHRMLFNEYYEILIGVSVITYFLHNKDYINLARLTKWSLVFLGITAIMTIISSAMDPFYARNLVGLSGVDIESERQSILSYRKFGGGTYATAAAFMCLFPIFIYYYKNNKRSLISKKQIILISIIISFALLGMQIFGNILIATAFGFIALFGMKKIRQSILVIALVFLFIIIIPKNMYVNGLKAISENIKIYPELNYKIIDLANFIESDSDINSNTGTGGRVKRYPMLFNTYLKSPLFGCYFYSDQSGNGYKSEGSHLYWMNKLTVTGIIGLLVFLFIPYKLIKTNLKLFNSAYKFYYLLATVSLLSYGLIKAILGREIWYTFFIILPGLYFLPLLNSRKYLSTDKSKVKLSKY